MLLEADKFTGNPLPDVSQGITLPGGVAGISGAAGLRSGTDYAAVVKAMAYKPLTPAPRARDMSAFDAPLPTPDEQRLEKSRMERKVVASLVRQSAEGYSPPIPNEESPLEGPSLFPETTPGASNNSLLNVEAPLSTPPLLNIGDEDDDPLKFAF